MSRLQFFKQIPVEAPLERIYARLGYRSGITEVSPEQAKEIRGQVDQARAILNLSGAARRLAIKAITESSLAFGAQSVINSKLAAGIFAKCSELLFLGATAGEEIVKFINYSKEENLTRGVIFDAVASETVDACFDWIIEYYNRSLQRENKQIIPKRISCGYGDFSLTNQKMIYRLLNLKKLKVTLNRKLILIPEKSVTAVAGIINKS